MVKQVLGEDTTKNSLLNKVVALGNDLYIQQ
jgi:hypothetical protein